MTISKTLDGDKLIIALEGRLDTLTAPDLEKEVSDLFKDVRSVFPVFPAFSPDVRTFVNAPFVQPGFHNLSRRRSILTAG